MVWDAGTRGTLFGRCEKTRCRRLSGFLPLSFAEYPHNARHSTPPNGGRKLMHITLEQHLVKSCQQIFFALALHGRKKDSFVLLDLQ